MIDGGPALRPGWRRPPPAAPRYRHSVTCSGPARTLRKKRDHADSRVGRPDHGGVADMISPLRGLEIGAFRAPGSWASVRAVLRSLRRSATIWSIGGGADGDQVEAEPAAPASHEHPSPAPGRTETDPGTRLVGKRARQDVERRLVPLKESSSISASTVVPLLIAWRTRTSSSGFLVVFRTRLRVWFAARSSTVIPVAFGAGRSPRAAAMRRRYRSRHSATRSPLPFHPDQAKPARRPSVRPRNTACWPRGDLDAGVHFSKTNGPVPTGCSGYFCSPIAATPFARRSSPG